MQRSATVLNTECRYCRTSNGVSIEGSIGYLVTAITALCLKKQPDVLVRFPAGRQKCYVQCF